MLVPLKLMGSDALHWIECGPSRVVSPPSGRRSCLLDALPDVAEGDLLQVDGRVREVVEVLPLFVRLRGRLHDDAERDVYLAHADAVCCRWLGCP